MTQSSASKEQHISPTFFEEHLPRELERGVKELGYVTPTSFQVEVFLNFKQGKNIVATSESSYGKSLAFCLPILSKIDASNKGLQALIITETALQSELCAKECRALGRHFSVLVSHVLPSDLSQMPQILVLPVSELIKSEASIYTPVTTIFFDGLSLTNAEQAIRFLDHLKHRQFLVFGKDAINALGNAAPELIESAVCISNNDQPKITTPAKHIYHQAKEALPKPRALLAALELHHPYNALITVNEAQECELLARYLARYGYKTIVVSEENNRYGLNDALKDMQKNTVVICQNSLVGSSLEAVAFMINYDMFDRAQNYEKATQFNKQKTGLTRTIVNILSHRELGFLGPIKAQCLIDFVEMPLPSEDEVLALAATRIVDNLNEEARDIELSQFEALTQKIMEEKAAPLALSYLLRNHFLKPKEGFAKEQRERPRQRPISERPLRGDREEVSANLPQDEDEKPARSSFDIPEGISRLYITLGKRDGFSDLASLAQYLSEKSNVDLGHFSGSGMIRDTSAHIEVDEDMAEPIIEALNGSARPNVDDGSEESSAPVICEKARMSPPRQFRRPPHHRRRPNFQRRR